MQLSATDSWTVEFDATRLVFGPNAIDGLGETAREVGCSRVLLVTDGGLCSAGHAARAVAAIERAGLACRQFDRVTENPTTRMVEEGVACAKEFEADGLIGLGGGSPLDCAKGINFLVTGGGRMEDYWGAGKARGPMLPSIGVPTTAGTGSDAQSYALISQESTALKMACGDRKAKFRAVILDPVIAATVPAEVARISGLDAVSHVVESFVSLRANPISRTFAARAWSLLESHLDAVFAGRNDAETWGAMLLGAHLAGASIEHSMLGAAHACANPLTQLYGVTHGAAVAAMLLPVMRFNYEAVAERYAELHPTLIDRVAQLQHAAGLDKRLADYGVPRDRLAELAEAAARQWTAGFNPRPVGRDELVELYEAAY